MNKKQVFLVWLPIIIIIALIIAFIVPYFIKNKAPAYTDQAHTLAQGKQLFTTHCSSCHAMTEDGMGPRLGGITSIQSEEMLLSFIKNPSKIIESGNARAVTLQRKYKQLMPSYDFIETEKLRSILAYIHHETSAQNIASLVVDTASSAKPEKSKIRYSPPVKKSDLVIELEDYIKIPRADSSPPDKGVATLRAHPSGDGTIYVSDQVGVIYRIDHAKADTFLNVRSNIPQFTFTPGIGTGLGSFAFHPEYLFNRLIYTTHAEPYTGKPADIGLPDTFSVGLQWILCEWKMNDIKQKVFSGTRREMLRINTPTTAHGVQDISFVPTRDKKNPDYGMLFLGIGDGGSNNMKHPELAHNKQSVLGTVLRIDPRGTNSKNGRYGIPPDNPFVQDPNPATRKEIWAYGFRNPHRLAWDLTNGTRMFVADIGESNIEELNVIRKGADYGWSNVEGNYGIATKKDLKKIYSVSREELSHFQPPFAQYDHVDGNAISGGYIYKGNLAALKNKYVFGDIANGKLFYINIDPQLSDSSIYELSIDFDHQPTDLRQLNHTKRIHLRIGYDFFANNLYIMTKDGSIRKVTNAFIKKKENHKG